MLLLAMLLISSPALLHASDDLGRLLVVYPVIDVEPVTGEILRLGQIARVVDTRESRSGYSPAELELNTPEFNGVSWVSLNEVARWLTSFDALKDFEVLGPDRIRLQVEASKSQAANVIQEGALTINHHVTAHWPEQYRRLQYRFLGKAADLPIYDDTQWSLSSEHLTTLGRRASVRLTINRDGALKNVMLWYEVTGDTRAWRAADDLGVHQPADPRFFNLTWISLSNRDAQSLGSPDPAHRLTVAVPAGEVLTRQSIEPIPAIEYGQAVSVQVSSPGLRVTAKATAKQTAGIGEEVKMASQSTDQIFRGVVVAPGVVEINHGLTHRRVQ